MGRPEGAADVALPEVADISSLLRKLAANTTELAAAPRNIHLAAITSAPLISVSGYLPSLIMRRHHLERTVTKDGHQGGVVWCGRTEGEYKTGVQT